MKKNKYPIGSLTYQVEELRKARNEFFKIIIKELKIEKILKLLIKLVN